MEILSYFNGKLRDVAKLAPEDVRVEHVAHCLANLNRYNGNTPVPYSVAQHAVLVGELCASYAIAEGLDEDVCRYEGLHHDTTEAYMGDIMGPLKRLLWVDWPTWSESVREFEARLRSQAVAPALGLEQVEPAYVHAMDLTALAFEQRFLQGREDVHTPPDVFGLSEKIIRHMMRPMYWRRAEQAFMDAHLACLPEVAP